MVRQALQSRGLRPIQRVAHGNIPDGERQGGGSPAVRVRDVDDSQAAAPPALAPIPPHPVARDTNTRTNHVMSYRDEFELAGCENLDTTFVQVWDALCGGRLPRGRHRPQRQAMVGKLESISGKKNGEGGPLGAQEAL